MVSLATVYRPFHKEIRRLYFNQYEFFLSHFLEPGSLSFKAFLSTLQASSGAIFGGVARCIISFNELQPTLRRIPPFQLDIAVPYSNGRYLAMWTSFFNTLGYHVKTHDIPSGIPGYVVKLYNRVSTTSLQFLTYLTMSPFRKFDAKSAL